MNTEIRNLEPKPVWGYFNEILQIPRPSGKEEKIIAYLKAFGEKLKLETLVDEVGNVLIRNLLCSRRAGAGGVYAIELTALQFSDPRVTPWSRC